MCKMSLAIISFLYVPSFAIAGARIDLRPEGFTLIPGNPPTVFIPPGQTVNMEVYFVDTGNPQGNIPFRGLFLDFSDTDFRIIQASNWAGSDGVFFNDPSTPQNEAFDNAGFSWVNPFGIGAVFIGLPHASWVYPLPTPNPLFQTTLPDGGELFAGGVSLTVPTEPGAFLLDVMNADVADTNFGARADFGFGGLGDPVTTWRSFSGELTGGKLLIVNPEPGALTLLGWATLIASRRRRLIQKR